MGKLIIHPTFAKRINKAFWDGLEKLCGIPELTEEQKKKYENMSPEEARKELDRVFLEITRLQTEMSKPLLKVKKDE